MQVGFIGVGRMGSCMLRNLSKKFEMLAFDMQKSNLETFKESQNITLCNSIDDLKNSSHVFLMLPDDLAVKKVCLDVNGLFSNIKKQSRIYDCSTISPKTSLQLSNIAKKHKIEYIDVPVSGGVAKAEAGELVFLVGSDGSTFSDDIILFEQMGRKAFLTGKPGSGLLAKLCNNVLLAMNILILSKCYALSSKHIAPEILSKIFNSSTGGSWANSYYCPVPGIVPTAPSSNCYKNGFDIKLMIKDLELARDYFTEPHEIGQLIHNMIDAFQNTRDFIEDGPMDFSVIYKYLLQFNAASKSEHFSDMTGK